MRHIIGVGLLSVLLSACVSTEKFEASEAALASCRGTLELCRANAASLAERCAGAQRQQGERIDALTQELESCRKDVVALRGRAQAELLACIDARHALETWQREADQALHQCRRALAAAQVSTQQLSERAALLRHQLQDEIASKDVEIEQLKDQLSVRVLDRILFHSGSAEILAPGRNVLDKLATVVAASDDYIRVEGHTDTVPISARLQEKYPTNWELSAARASSVVRHFETAHKIDPLRLEAVGFSKYRPVAEGSAPEELQRNRRVEIVLTAGGRR